MSSVKRRSANGARERLIESHLPLVTAVAKRYAGRGVELDDLVQVGAVGLVNASDRFDPKRGVGFPAFAVATIEGEIRHHLRDRSSLVRIPRRLQRLGGEARRCEAELAASLGRAPTVAEIARALQADEDDVCKALVAQEAAEPVALAGNQPAAGRVAVESLSRSEDRLLLARGMRVLDDRERQVIYLRFHGDMTERQIARELGISQAQVSRLSARALDKLRAELPNGDDPGGDITAQALISALAAGGDGAAASPTAAGPVPAASGRGATPAVAKTAAGHSGRFLVRMPSELHEALARAAATRDVSLNRFVTDTLAAAVSGQSPAPGSTGGVDEDGPSVRPPAPRTIRTVLVANVIVIAAAGILAVALVALALLQGI
ncbi:MAG: sigma-70 family RNA polymerase sigma factor [Solirubrobacteraceae bacterium]